MAAASEYESLATVVVAEREEPTMYVLYHHPFSQHCRRVRALLEEAGLEHELRTVDLANGEHMSPAYLATNPNHQVPTLLDGDFKLHDSHTILRYLCGKHRLTDWYPEDLRARATVDQWLDWNHCRLGPAVVDIVLNKVFMGDRADRAAIERGESRVAELAPILDAGVAERDFLAGKKPTIADLSIGSAITQLALADAVPKQPNIARWMERLAAIDGFTKVLPKR